MKRFLAFLAAVFMILVAVLVRSAIDGAPPFGSSPRNDGQGEGGRFRLLCATELTEVCSAVESDGLAEVAFADSGAVVDRLVAGQAADFDAWLIAGPWDRILADNLRFSKATENKQQDQLGAAGPVLARSPVVLVAVDSATSGRITAACPDGIGTACATKDPSIAVGVASPARGDGLVVLAQAVAGDLGTSDFDATDLQDAGLDSWISSLADTSRNAGLGSDNPLLRMVIRRGQFQAAGALEADAANLSDRLGQAQILYPHPLATADVRLVPASEVNLTSSTAKRISSTLGRALAATGWRVGGAPPRQLPDAPVIPGASGLPEDAGVMQVLREIWGAGG